MSDPKDALLRACNAAGSQTALAMKVGLKSQGSISDWLRKGRVPAERVLDVERASGISRHELRPDIYPQDTVAA